MALSEELPIYRELAKLEELYCDQLPHLSRMVRYEFGYQLVNLCIYMKVLVYMVNSSNADDKRCHLRKMQEKYHTLKEVNRVCLYMKAFSSEGAGDVITQTVAEVGRHITRWCKATMIE